MSSRSTLRPARHTKADIETCGLSISPSGDIRRQHDPYGSFIGRLTNLARTQIETLKVGVEFTYGIQPVNPFDLFIDDRCEDSPFAYQPEVLPDLAPFLDWNEAPVAGGMWLEKFFDTLPRACDSVH